MEQWIAWLAALVSFSAFLVLWFREVRRMLRSLKSIVDSALEQAAAEAPPRTSAPPEFLRAAKASCGRPWRTTIMR